MKLSTTLRKFHAALLIGCFFMAANASATLLVEQLPAVTAVGQQADNSTGPYAESVAVPAPASIKRISWWGYYLAGSTLDDSFVIALGGKTQSGSVKSVADGSVDGLDLYRYELTLATPFAVTGVTPLELALVNDSFDVEWYWQGAATLDGRRALVMLQVPEPGTLGVFAIGLLVLARSSRRRLTRS